MKWEPEDFVGVSVPESTRLFLMGRGLPETIPFTTFDFGATVPEGGGVELVVGFDFDDWPVVVDSEGVVHVDYKTGRWLFNSTVELLAETIDEYVKMKEADEDDVASSVARFRSFLATRDPQCLARGDSVWKVMLADFEAMAC